LQRRKEKKRRKKKKKKEERKKKKTDLILAICFSNPLDLDMERSILRNKMAFVPAIFGLEGNKPMIASITLDPVCFKLLLHC
jgi:hypothetical protein